jgi:glucosamine-6-phosphate deaminase
MEVIILPDLDKAALLTARIIERELRAKPELVMGMATGRTMERVYAYLVDIHRKESLDFSRCRTFNLDEYIGLGADHPKSYRRYMQDQLFDHVNIDAACTHLPNGLASDLSWECRSYEALIQAAGGIDLQLLGIGASGHIGFNEPISALASRTREKALTPSTRQQNAAMFGGDASQVPLRAITMGVGTILEAKRCILVATGAAKAGILAKAVEGPITSMVTASALQLHPNCQVIVDEEAAAGLQGEDYYRWIFQNEAEWRDYQDLDAMEPR